MLIANRMFQIRKSERTSLRRKLAQLASKTHGNRVYVLPAPKAVDMHIQTNQITKLKLVDYS